MNEESIFMTRLWVLFFVLFLFSLSDIDFRYFLYVSINLNIEK